MKLLSARRIGSDFRYVVHLDETQTIPDPEWADPGDGSTAPQVPDPAWVLDLTYGAGPRTGAETGPQYAARLTAFEASARRETKALAIERLAARRAHAQKPADVGVALTGEGAAL